MVNDSRRVPRVVLRPTPVQFTLEETTRRQSVNCDVRAPIQSRRRGGTHEIAHFIGQKTRFNRTNDILVPSVGQPIREWECHYEDYDGRYHLAEWVWRRHLSNDSESESDQEGLDDTELHTL